MGEEISEMIPILTATVGTNADLIPKVFELYVKKRDKIADVTYGKGVFWKNINKSNYEVFESDLVTGIDFRHLPYKEDYFDCVILDPPYMHGGKTALKGISKCYRNRETAEHSSHEALIRLYASGILETVYVLKKHGILLLKTQDEIEGGKQRFTHVEFIQLLEIFGFKIIDLFILVQSTIPAMQFDYQKTARKNHSYLIVAEFRR